MNHQDPDKARCPIARSLEAIGDAWSLLIIRDAMHGKRRFGEFQKSLGIAKNILTCRLKKLVVRGVMEVVPGGGAYHEYVLTEKGRSLYPVVAALQQWGERCCPGATPPEPSPADRPQGDRAAEGDVHRA